MASPNVAPEPAVAPVAAGENSVASASVAAAVVADVGLAPVSSGAVSSSSGPVSSRRGARPSPRPVAPARPRASGATVRRSGDALHVDAELTARRRSLAAMVVVGALLAGGVAVMHAISMHRDEPAAVAVGFDAAPGAPTADASVVGVPVVAAVPDAGADAAPTPRIFRVRQLLSADTEYATGVVGHKTFTAALAKAGLPAKEIARISACFQHLHTFDSTHPKDEFRFVREKHGGAVLGFEYDSSPSDVLQARSENGDLHCAKLSLALEYVHRTGVVAPGDGDIHAAIVRAGFEPELGPVLDDALDGHVDLAHVHSGARIRVVAQEERANGAFSSYPAVLALEYLPASRKASPFRIYAYAAGSKGNTAAAARGVAYYDGKGERGFEGAFSMPIPFARVTSRFNPRRMHPVLHTIMPHNGVDYGGSTGTPVYAVAAGTIKFASDSGPCGNMVQIEHPASLVTAYCHLSRFAAGLKVGQHVDRKQLVGYVGQTGRVTGPHLHFAVKRNDKFIDPLSLKLGGMVRLGRADKTRFDEQKSTLDAELEGIALPQAADVADEPDPAGETDELSEGQAP